MDLNLARTFLAVVYSGSFILAAQHLCVSQTTVTARIKNLEQQLKAQLFLRNATGVSLTEQGELFIPYAQSFLNTWHGAVQTMQQQNQPQPLKLAAEISLWSPWLTRWFNSLIKQQPELHVTATVAEATTLLSGLDAGEQNVVLAHQPYYRPDMQVEQLVEEKLIQVAHPQQPEPWLFIDWGVAFKQQYQLAFPGQTQAQIQTNLGPLALQLILEHGGTGYFRTHVVTPYLASGQLVRNQSAPEFSLPIYVLYKRSNTHPDLHLALELLRSLSV
ncbi:LysR family transcriptional regulator [Thiopseudomonas acetoxidans]|uniref:LysR family transcriptional regulator n=1 Tax=Thiopseudomonas acetoxidans TaxID=3041622 RepID=A0ABT7SS67_9GAMM|nr:LysR family transcriptional regulator [Thiopseudomonas sp. CY1220]MDM7858422.1 LysR family transcriptional regulator [Thiopseudomonas sp. CY1220]